MGILAVSGWAALVALLAAGTPAAAEPAGEGPAGEGGQLAQSEAHLRFDIPAQDLNGAVLTFARVTGLQVFYEAARLDGLRSGGVSGTYSPAAAMDILLAGTGVTYSFISPTTVRLEMAASPAPGGAEDSLQLGAVTVTAGTDPNADSGAGFQGTPDWVYETPASVSVISREAIQELPARNTRDLFSGVAGVYVSNDNGQNPGTNVNIRGLQDQTRITMMIDGARQNFQRSAHGSSGQTYVDTAFIREVDIEKSTTSGVGGAASLGGSVNFRTLVADDLIEPGEWWGTEVDVTTGTNAYDFSGAASAAVRISDAVSVLAGVSYQTIGKYKIGKHHPNYNTYGGIYDQVPLGTDTWSGLLKTEIQPTDDMTVALSWMHYQSEFTYSTDSVLEDVNDITNDTVTIAFGWNPDGDLIDLKAGLWYNRTEDEEDRDARPVYGAASVSYQMQGFGGSLENTSRFTLPFADLALNYGVEAFRDDGDTEASGDVVDEDGWAAWWYQGANGSGTRDVVSGFANATIDPYDWLSITGGLRYDYYWIDGSTTIFTEQQVIQGQCLRYNAAGVCRVWEYTIIPQQAYDTDADLSGGALSPTFGVTVMPTDGLQLFAKYAHSYRPPTIMEALLGGSHMAGYSQRFAPNPWLEPETANTFEIGANLSYDEVLQPGDAFRMKAVGFYRRIDNYIAMGALDLDEGSYQVDYTAYVNLDGDTTMRGIELEVNYDAGRYYLGGSLTYLDADYASTYSYDGESYTTDSYILFVPPKTKFTLDGGLRFFDETLTLGGRVTYVGSADDNIGGGASASLVSTWQTSEYTLYDLYGSYEVTPEATLRFAVTNVTNVNYVPAMGQYFLPAPGRTGTLSLNLKF